MNNLDLEGDDARLDDDAQALIDAVEAGDDVGVDSAARAGDPPAYSAVRDEQGRFAPRPQDGADQQQDQGQQPERPATPVTFKEMTEFLQEQERRQAAERERDELRRQLGQRQQPQRQGPDPELMFTDPAEYHRQMERQSADREFRLMERFAKKEHGETLAEARRALFQTGNEALARSLMNEDNPFDAVVAWHKREKTLAAIPDGDLSKYEAGLQDRFLKDPAFLQRAQEAARAMAGQQPGRAPGSNVHRLPSAARAGTAAAIAAIPDDLSDEDLLESIVGSRR